MLVGDAFGGDAVGEVVVEITEGFAVEGEGLEVGVGDGVVSGAVGGVHGVGVAEGGDDFIREAGSFGWFCDGHVVLFRREDVAESILVFGGSKVRKGCGW